ncbi:DivIVA domain-containing protein [Streptomyces mirabilis]|uniref:DivIVA domain-containing protein n=1 Tax=Streptomyces mirabilis TaxID=68239 RepID=UPI0033F60AD0
MAMPLNLKAVRNSRFKVVLPGYHMEEVDLFVKEVEEELSRLLCENDELLSRLGNAIRAAAQAEARRQADRGTSEHSSPAAALPQPAAPRTRASQKRTSGPHR